MGVDNPGLTGDRDSYYPHEESFMIDVSGQVKKNKQKQTKVEQVMIIFLHLSSVFA